MLAMPLAWQLRGPLLPQGSGAEGLELSDSSSGIPSEELPLRGSSRGILCSPPRLSPSRPAPRITLLACALTCVRRHLGALSPGCVALGPAHVPLSVVCLALAEVMRF